VADLLGYTALLFGDRRAISPDDREKAPRFGFEVATPRAYPVVLRKERRDDFRRPDARELELLEACPWVMPDFLKWAEDRTLEMLEYTFMGVTGKMTLDLSWVSKKRLRVDRPEG
jgi:hypothetical protein